MYSSSSPQASTNACTTSRARPRPRNSSRVKTPSTSCSSGCSRHRATAGDSSRRRRCRKCGLQRGWPPAGGNGTRPLSQGGLMAKRPRARMLQLVPAPRDYCVPVATSGFKPPTSAGILFFPIEICAILLLGHTGYIDQLAQQSHTQIPSGMNRD